MARWAKPSSSRRPSACGAVLLLLVLVPVRSVAGWRRPRLSQDRRRLLGSRSREGLPYATPHEAPKPDDHIEASPEPHGDPQHALTALLQRGPWFSLRGADHQMSLPLSRQQMSDTFVGAPDRLDTLAFDDENVWSEGEADECDTEAFLEHLGGCAHQWRDIRACCEGMGNRRSFFFDALLNAGDCEHLDLMWNSFGCASLA
mmetsp:Transcript_77353/g.224419  ORF Transcript_77353/g.224419 Transcript_77353/m.224419 type:complete len:202 (+) Transcript_77353:102-707(+)